jgi:hypothetical protein
MTRGLLATRRRRKPFLWWLNSLLVAGLAIALGSFGGCQCLPQRWVFVQRPPHEYPIPTWLGTVLLSVGIGGMVLFIIGLVQIYVESD